MIEFRKKPVALMMKYVAIILFVISNSPLLADELRPAYLQLTEVEPQTFSVLWKVPARGNQRLSLDVQLGADHQVIQNPIEGFVDGYHLRNWKISVVDELPQSQVTISGLAQTSTEVLLRIEYLDGASLTHRFTPATPEYVIAKKPTLLQTAYSYLSLGIEHILLGFDHLLFVLALLLLIDNTRKLIVTITFFTIAHSITLSLAALDYIFVPVPPVEAIIALSIVFVASEIIRVQQGRDSLTYRKPWIVAFSFGLLHGLGFAAALAQIGLPVNAIPLALVSFNIGVEIGQLIFIFAFLLLGWLISRVRLNLHRGWKKVPPYVIGSLASFWLIERSIGFLS
ncbi:MAG: HupE/UreJ family protein [Gammaproteobacteria bacterium]|jgi:hydrogenase/urease accessory protein HupE